MRPSAILRLTDQQQPTPSVLAVPLASLGISEQTTRGKESATVPQLPCRKGIVHVRKAGVATQILDEGRCLLHHRVDRLPSEGVWWNSQAHTDLISSSPREVMESIEAFVASLADKR